MNKFRAVKNYRGKSDAEVLAKGRKVYQDLGGNANFPTPVPALSVLNTKLDEYEAAISNAAYGGTHLIAAKNEKRAEVIDILQRLAIYVDLNSPDSEASILETGFDVYKTGRSVAPASGTPTILKGKDGEHSGDSIIRSKRMDNATSNQLRYTPDPITPDSIWIVLEPQSKATFLVSGLTPGVLYWFQTRTISTKGLSDWSAPFPFSPR